MQTDQYKQDVARGEIGSDELRERLLAVLELTEQQQQTIQEQRQRIAELERLVE